MSAPTKPVFIAIDDDAIFNMVTELTIKSDFPNVEVRTFLDPIIGLEFIKGINAESENGYVLLLDINMPVLNGWEVLEKIQAFGDFNKQRLKIFILSSSVDSKDKEKAEKNPIVSAYIEKPLKKASLEEIIKNMKDWVN